LITNCTAKTFAHMTARVSYQVRQIYQLFITAK